MNLLHLPMVVLIGSYTHTSQSESKYTTCNGSKMTANEWYYIMVLYTNMRYIWFICDSDESIKQRHDR